MEMGNAEDCAAVQTALRKWQEDAEMASIRDPAALALPPAQEKNAFGRLWGDVAALLRGR
jgi:hypothetical protein